MRLVACESDAKWNLQTLYLVPRVFARSSLFNPRLLPAHCLLLLVSLLSAFSCFACCGYKRGVDYKIMKIYGSPSKASRWMERKGYAICRAFRELCPWPVMKMAEQRWQLPGTLSTLSAAFSYLLSFFLTVLLAPPLQVYSLYRRNWIDTPISLILSSLFTTPSLGNEAFYVSFTRNRMIFELLAFTAENAWKISVNINWIPL